MRQKLGDICEIVSGSTPKTGIREYWDGNLKWITPAELNDDSRTVFDTNRKITDLGAKKTGLSSFPAGTVLLSSRAPIGKVAIAGCEMYCNQGFKNLICSDAINNKYLFWFLKGNTRYLNSLGRGATFKEISKSVVSNIELNVPSIEEQQKAVSVLEKVDARMSILNKELVRLDELVKARFVEMFSSNTPNYKKLSKITDVITKGTTPTTAGFDFIDSGVNFFKIESISEAHTINLDKVAHVSEECHAALKRSQLHAGDILFSIAGAIGRTAVIGPNDLPGNTNQALAIIRLSKDSGVSQKYLISALDSPEVFEQCRTKKRGVAQINLSLQDIGNIEIPVPSMEGQRSFELFVDQVDKSKFTLSNELTMCNFYIRLVHNCVMHGRIDLGVTK